MWRNDNLPCFDVPRKFTYSDQGLDLNVIYPYMVDKMDLKLRDMREIDPRRLFMSVTSGGTVELKN